MLGKFEQVLKDLKGFYLNFICISGALDIVCFGTCLLNGFVES